MKQLITLFALMVLSYQVCSQNFTRSNLPIVIVNTAGPIFDEPKTDGEMRILHNRNAENIITQDSSHFQGRIGIEIRGQSSQFFPKNGYGIETRDDLGEDDNVELLDMPKESDWVIHSPYSDKSLVRNALAYHLASKVMAYAPRIKLAEFVLNGDYQGVILWTEKIKRDKNRVDISKLEPDENEGDDLTGGYIMRFDKADNNEVAWVSQFNPIQNNSARTRFIYRYPKVNDITPMQTNYIKDYITNFENVLMSDDFDDPINGYRKYADVSSFVQLMIINELSRNVDGYRLSTYMYKDKDSKGGKLTMGPVWDYNLAFGNADYCAGSNISGWAYDFNEVCPDDFWVNHVWWNRLLEDNGFKEELKETWSNLRSDLFSDQSLLGTIDSLTQELSSAQQRNFTRWRILGQYVWPNQYVGATYAQEVDYLKDWLIRRVAWMDNEIGLLTTTSTEVVTSNTSMFPNPTKDIINFDFSKNKEQPDYIELYNAQGQMISDHLFSNNVIQVSIRHFDSQVIYARIFRKGKLLEIRKLIKIS